jgi:hypothetical protein
MRPKCETRPTAVAVGCDGEPATEPERHAMTHRNRTDYQFPDGWGLMADDQRDRWFKRERVRRRARRQSRESDIVGVRSPDER